MPTSTTVAGRAGWLRFLLGFAVLHGALVGLAGFDPSGRSGLVIALAVLATALLVDRVLGGPGTTASRIGLGRPGAPAVLVAVAVSVLVLGAYPLTTASTGASFALQADWPWILLGTFAFHGVAEELVWRGYAFRRLRAGRSFGRAVLLTMPLVAATHVPIIVTMGPAVGLAAMTVAAVTTLPLAHLYEAGRGTVWAPAVVHTAIDAFKVVVVPAAATTAFSLTLAAVSVLVPLTALLLRRRGPVDRDGLGPAIGARTAAGSTP